MLRFYLSDVQIVQHFRKGPVHEFYGLKASQMSKVRASFHKYSDVEKNQESWWIEFQRSGIQQPILDSEDSQRSNFSS